MNFASVARHVATFGNKKLYVVELTPVENNVVYINEEVSKSKKRRLKREQKSAGAAPFKVLFGDDRFDDVETVNVTRREDKLAAKKSFDVYEDIEDYRARCNHSNNTNKKCRLRSRQKDKRARQEELRLVSEELYAWKSQFSVDTLVQEVTNNEELIAYADDHYDNECLYLDWIAALMEKSGSKTTKQVLDSADWPYPSCSPLDWGDFYPDAYDHWSDHPQNPEEIALNGQAMNDDTDWVRQAYDELDDIFAGYGENDSSPHAGIMPKASMRPLRNLKKISQVVLY